MRGGWRSNSRHNTQRIVKTNVIHLQQFQPWEALASYVACYWYMDSMPNGNKISKCFPTGMLDIITVVGGSPHLFWKKDEWTPTPQAMVVGIRTEPVHLKTPRQNMVFGIRLYPETFLQLLGQPTRELLNNTEAVEDVFGEDISALTERITMAPDNEARVEICNRFFLRLLTRRQPRSNYLAEAVRQARQLGAQASAEALSRVVFVGERQLQRAFSEQIGISPKRYGRLVRFVQAARMPLQNPDLSWTDVSYDCGYADQAHLIRDFRTFTGENPSAILRDPVMRQMMLATAM